MPGELGQVHPTVRLPYQGGLVDVDENMVPLVQTLWARGFKTEGCCQDFGESIARNGHRSDTSAKHRKRHADFYRGYAWLKLPEPDALRLIAILGKDPVFGERVRRWTHPDAWQSITYVFPTDTGEARRTGAGQLTFPKNQLDALVRVLQAH